MSGGLSTIPDGLTHGAAEFSARFDEGQGTSFASLFWPSDDRWTDEIDIIETHRPDREGFAFTNHGDPNETVYVDGVDLTQWNTYRLEWTPEALTLFVNGEQRAEITGDVPSQPMSLGFQGHVHGSDEGWFGGAPDGSTPDRVEAEVDWVRLSRWTPGEGDVEPMVGASAAADDGTDWMAAARRYVENDGDWDGSWASQVADGQITLEDVAERIAAGEGNPEYWM